MEKQKFNRKPTTTSERREIRIEASRRLNGTKPDTKAGRAFLRRTIPIIKGELSDKERTELNRENHTRDVEIHDVVKESGREKKTYMGSPSDDNPQIWKREAKFASDSRRRVLEQLDDTKLLNVLARLLYDDLGNNLRENVLEVRANLINMELHMIPPLSQREKERVIEGILEAEKYNVHMERPSIRTTETQGSRNGEMLSTDKAFLESLSDLRLMEHLDKLLRNTRFKAHANRSRFQKLQILNASFRAPLYQFEKTNIIDAIVDADKDDYTARQERY